MSVVFPPTFPSLFSGKDPWSFVSEQSRAKQIRLRLSPETLALAASLQDFYRQADKPCSLESVVTVAIESLHDDLLSS